MPINLSAIGAALWTLAMISLCYCRISTNISEKAAFQPVL